MGEKKDAEKYLQEHGRLFGSGFAWVTYCVIFVILPTFLKYFYDFISKEGMLNIIDYQDDILLVLLSVSCSVFSICNDIRSRLIKKILRQTIVIIFTLAGVISLLLHIYIVIVEDYTYSARIIYMALVLIGVGGVIGYFVASHHKQYDDCINEAQKKILIRKKKSYQNSSGNQP